MKIYRWEEYGFIGTVSEFAKRFGTCKCLTLVNTVKRASRHVYNGMDARQQAYEEKRERVSPACRFYLDERRTHFIEITKDEYEAIALTVVQEEVGTCRRCYRNRILPASFSGNSRDDNPVASVMKRYGAEAVRFAEQVMLATGYFDTRPSEQPTVGINHTVLRVSYSNGIVFHFVASHSPDGICDCRLRWITLDGNPLYDGGCYRHSSVDDVLQMTPANDACPNAH